WRSPACPSTRPGSSARCSAGWRGRTRPRGRSPNRRSALMTETPDQTQELSPEVEEILEALYDVVDPELGVNVVDLGLIYGVNIDDDKVATIDMTLTSAACPLTDVIEEQAGAALEGLVSDFRINWIWMPPWGPENITEDGREQLRALGFNL